MVKRTLFFLLSLSVKLSLAQLPVARDTISVMENGYVLKMPWANGINFSNVSNLDLNADGKKDLVFFDRLNIYGIGRFRCFINTGQPGQTRYRESWYHSYLFPQVSNWAVFKDYDLDGKEDLFCSTNSGIRVYKNTSTSAQLSFELVKPLLYSNYPSGPSNLYASTIGVPGISDVDDDGDLDILSFSPQGIFLQLHRNMSVENGFDSDSLIFDYTNPCWGMISESNCEVNFNVCETFLQPLDSIKQPKTYHAGSCLTCLDSDGDADIDLIMGDISCNTVHYVHNTGSGGVDMFTDTTELYPNFPNKNNTSQIKMNSFPCAYPVDVNGDNKQDLIVTPNSYGTENYKSVWLYRNTSTTGTVNFQFVQNNFLQSEMIEVGQNSFPVMLDYDQDGKKDLLIGNYGYYNGTSLSAQLTLYRNTGTAAQPAYSLVTRDYASLSTRTLSNSLPINHAVPTVGDVDLDGDEDLLIGTSSGQIHWLENTAGSGNLCNFSVFHENPYGFTTPSGGAAPQLFDLDNDARLDLLIGMQNGRIAWYRNVSTSTTPVFTLMTSFLGSIDVKGDPNIFGFDGYAVPFFYRDAGVTQLLVGSFTGSIFQYAVPSVLSNTFSLITKSVNGLNEGSHSTVCYVDINNDGKRDLLVGNSGGGLNFFSSRSPLVGINEQSPEAGYFKVNLFPNPAKESISMAIGLPGFQEVRTEIRDICGKLQQTEHSTSNNSTLDISPLSAGVYFLTITAKDIQKEYRITKKILKE